MSKGTIGKHYTKYDKTTERMKAKEMVFLSDILTTQSKITEKIEFWSDKNGLTIILEKMRDGDVMTYKECKV